MLPSIAFINGFVKDDLFSSRSLDHAQGLSLLQERLTSKLHLETDVSTFIFNWVETTRLSMGSEKGARAELYLQIRLHFESEGPLGQEELVAIDDVTEAACKAVKSFTSITSWKVYITVEPVLKTHFVQIVTLNQHNN